MKEAIINLLSKNTKLKKEQVEDLMEIPPNPELGDYAFPCFILAKKLKKNPVEIAKDLAGNLKLSKEIEKIQAMGPYVNFFVNKKILAENVLKNILKKKKPKKKGKILIEHTSVNPNASAHVGRARNSIIGDSIKRIFEFAGFNTEVHYFVNDVSKQIAMMTLNCTGKEKFSQLLDKYSEIVKKVEKDKKLEKQVFEALNKYESGDKKTKEKFRKIVEIAIEGQKKIFNEFGIHFDYFDYESDYIKKSYDILKQLEKTGKLFTDEEKRQVLNQEGMGLEKMMRSPVLVLTRSDNTGLYPLRDMAYTIDKMKKSKKNLIVLGEDHKLYMKQIAAALKLLKKPSPEAIHYSFILIQKKDKTSKMSTRKGDVVLLEDFMREAVEKAKKEIQKREAEGEQLCETKKTKNNERGWEENAKKVGFGAVKYAIIKNSPDRNIIFNMEDALNFEGDSGPYLQYSYARASSIIKKAKNKPGKLKINKITIQETELIKKLSQFEEVVEKARQNLNPSLIANYSFELAQKFNEFYHAEKVIGSEEEQFRLTLVDVFRKVLKNSLSLLGIEVMEEM